MSIADYTTEELEAEIKSRKSMEAIASFKKAVQGVFQAIQYDIENLQFSSSSKLYSLDIPKDLIPHYVERIKEISDTHYQWANEAEDLIQEIIDRFDTHE